MITRAQMKQIKSMDRKELSSFLDKTYQRGVHSGLEANVSEINIDQENIDKFNSMVSSILNEEFKIGPTRYARVQPALEDALNRIVYELVSNTDVRMQESDD